MACHVAKFQGVTPFNPKVIGANTLNYKPIVDPPLKKNCWGSPHASEHDAKFCSNRPRDLGDYALRNKELQ